MSLRTAAQPNLSSSALALAFVISLTAALSAQQPKVLAPHKPVAPLVTPRRELHKASELHSMVGGLWMTDANFKSTIYLRNDVETDPITVTPILWLSNGKKFMLHEVTLEPAGVAVINVNQALADKGLAYWATLTGYVEVQYTWQWDALCVIVWSVDTSHSLILTSGLAPSSSAARPAVPPQTSILEGMWWKQEANVSGFVALSNTSSDPIQAAVQVSDAAGNALGTHSVTISSHGTRVVKMPELQSASSNAGGVRIAYTGAIGTLIPNGGLEDPAVGYSARMPFNAPPDPTITAATDTYAELGLMNGAADPMMSFPAGTTFTPYSVVRNVSSKPIQLTPTLWWMEGGAPRSAASRPITVTPGQTQDLDPVALLSAAGLKNFNGSVNLILAMQGVPGGLLLASGSVDRKNTYVFEVMATRVHEGLAKSFSYWSIANGDDTMVTLWNPADEAQDFLFTLFFTGGHYDFPIHLGPRATNTFNVSEIVHNQLPDADGNVIPASIHEGSARISGTLGTAQSILVSMAAGTYNVVKATCGEGCQTCDGWEPGSEIEVSPLGMAVGGTDTVKFIVPFKDGTQRDYTAQTTWKTSNTSIATVQSAGVIKGMAAGSFTTTTTGPPLTPAVPCCNLEGGCCAPASPPGGSGPGVVQVPTYFGPTGYTTTSGDCPSGAVGTFINVSDQVLGQDGNAMQISGITPQEKVCVAGSCQPSYNTFSTPVSTTTAGTFSDVPIGTCFGPPAPTTNVCVTVSVTYQAYLFGPTNIYPITTASGREDCVNGEKDQISGNPTGYDQTYTSGTVP